MEKYSIPLARICNLNLTLTGFGALLGFSRSQHTGYKPARAITPRTTTRSMAGLFLALLFMLALPVYTAAQIVHTVEIGLPTTNTVSAIETAINAALTGASSGDEVLVTGTFSGAASMLTIDYVPTDTKLVWKANYSGSVSLISLIHFQNTPPTGTGTVEILGGVIRNDGSSAIISHDRTELLVIGEDAKIEGSNSQAVITQGPLTIEGNASFQNSIVRADGDITISGNAKVDAHVANAVTSAGNILVKDNAWLKTENGNTIVNNGNVTVEGGLVETVSGSAIRVSDPNYLVTVSGGFVRTTSTTDPATAINTTGDVTVSGGEVSAAGSNGSAIHISIDPSATVTTTPAITVSGGTVSATGNQGRAINIAQGTSSTVQIKPVIHISGGAVIAAGLNSWAVYADVNTESAITVDGTGKVQATGNLAEGINLRGNLTVTDNAEVSAAAGYAVYNNSAGTITVSGNSTVRATDIYDAIHIGVASGGITVTGNARVMATSGHAIYTGTVSCPITVNGGLVFAYGNAVLGSSGTNQVICSDATNFTGVTGAGEVVAWNQAALNTTYNYGTTTDITSLPAGSATWAINGSEHGIAYTNGTNTGFIPLSGITVSSITGGTIVITRPAGNATAEDFTTINAATGSSEFDVTAAVWTPGDATFAPGTAYSVELTLTAKTGASFIGLAAGATAFSVTNATTVTNTATADGGATITVTVDFPATDAAQTITFPNPTVTRTYGDAAFIVAATRSVGDGAVSYAISPAGVATVNATTGEVTILKPGTATVTATAAAVPGLWSLESATYDLTVNPITLTITAGGYSVAKDYDGTTSAGTASGALGGADGILAGDATAGITLTATPQPYPAANAGSYNVTVDLSLNNNGDGKYALAGSTVAVPGVITKAAPALGTHYASNVLDARAYNGNPQAVTVSLITTPTVFTGLGVPTFTYTNSGGTAYGPSSVAPTNAGAYSVTAVFAEGTNFNAVTTPVALGTMTVGKAVAPTGVNQTFYVATNLLFTYNFALTTLLPDVSPLSLGDVTYAVTAVTNGSSVLSTTPPIAAATSPLALNVANIPTPLLTATVELTVTSANFADFTADITVETVDKTPVTITATMNGGTYNGNPFGYSAASVAETAGGAAVNGLTLDALYESTDGAGYNSATAPVDAGAYKLTLSVPALEPTYIGSGVFAFTVSKATVTVRADDKTVIQGAALPAPTVSYSGFLGADNVSITLLTDAVAQHTAADASTPGTFPITFSTNAVLNGTNGANYILNHVDGVLTVNPVTVPTAPLGFTATAGNGQVSLAWTAPASDGGSVITGYQVSSDNGATWVTASSNTGHTFTGLTNGTAYTFQVRAVNSVGAGATATVTATPTGSGTVITPPTLYDIHIGTFSGGTVTANKASAAAGETVTLTITPDAGYTLTSITVTSATLSGMGVTRTFTMPAADVTVTAAFRQMTNQEAWTVAKAIIETASFYILQKDTDTPADLRNRLADIINELINSTGIVLSPDDIDLISVVPAIAGDAVNRSGINGSFAFTVTPPSVGAPASNSGVIVATAYDATANEQWTMDNGQLKAWVQNSILYVSGLIEGKPWYVYNILGTLVYQSVAFDGKAEIALPGRGIYIVVNGQTAVKVNN